MVYFVNHGLWDKLKRNLINALAKLGCTEYGEVVTSSNIYVWGKLPFDMYRPYIRFQLPLNPYDDAIFIHLAQSVDPSDASMTGAVEVYDTGGDIAHGYLINAIANETFVFKNIGYPAGYGLLITAVDGVDGKTYYLVRGYSYSINSGWLYSDTTSVGCSLTGLGNRQVALDGKIKASNVLVSVSNVYYGVARNLLLIGFGVGTTHYSPILRLGTDYYDSFMDVLWYKVDTAIETVD